MWLRRLLVEMYGLEERSAHTPEEVGWPTLPDRCVLQIHWRRSRAFRKQLRKEGFQVVVLVRHPLDVLLSILQFAPHEPETARWLGGLHGDERAILGLDPTSPVFAAYATGRRARALVDVSPQSWDDATFATRYEDLLSAPEPELRRLWAAVGITMPAVSPAEAIERVSFAGLAAEARNRHFWQGRAGHWRELLPAPVASQLARPYDALMLRFGYSLDPDSSLTAPTARLRWAERVAPGDGPAAQ